MPPKRNPEIYIDDMCRACRQILKYTADLTQNDFETDQKTIDAVTRNFEVLGEAARKVPDSFRRKNSKIPWKEVSDMRNLLIHEYFGVDAKILWQTVQEDVQPLLVALETLKAS